MNFDKLATAFIDKALTSIQKTGKAGKEHHIISDNGVIYFTKSSIFMCDEQQIIVVSDKFCYVHEHGAHKWNIFNGDIELTKKLIKKLKF